MGIFAVQALDFSRRDFASLTFSEVGESQSL